MLLRITTTHQPATDLGYLLGIPIGCRRSAYGNVHVFYPVANAEQCTACLAPEHLERLRARSVGAKRSLAIREYALGLEALHRFVEREPLYRVRECVFGVLALESEPVDPRL